MKVGIVIVNYNGNKHTIECLESLSKIDNEGIGLEVIVVDNNSEEAFSITKDYKAFSLKLIRNKENQGFAKGSNTGIKESLSLGCDYVLILNNDTTHDENFLIKLIDEIKGKGVGIVSPKIYFTSGREFHKQKYSKEDSGKVIWYAGGTIDWKNVLGTHVGVDEVDKGQFENSYETDFATGCAMLVKREVFEKIGYFDERYFLYLEDLDLSIRAKKAGYSIRFAPDSIIWHYNAGSTGGSGAYTHDYFITRNRMLFGSKFSSPRAKLALARESLRLLLTGRKWQRIGIKDYYLGKLGIGSFR